jgi:hypothetical protein
MRTLASAQGSGGEHFLNLGDYSLTTFLFRKMPDSAIPLHV